MPLHRVTRPRNATVDKVNKTTPALVEESNKGLFHATMNLPNAAKHCGMTEREMKMTFREYIKYQDVSDVLNNPDND